MGVEVGAVTLLGSHKERDAVMGAGDDEGDVGLQSNDTVVAKSVEQQDRIEGRLIDAVYCLLDLQRHLDLPDIVQSLVDIEQGHFMG